MSFELSSRFKLGQRVFAIDITGGDPDIIEVIIDQVTFQAKKGMGEMIPIYYMVGMAKNFVEEELFFSYDLAQDYYNRLRNIIG